MGQSLNRESILVMFSGGQDSATVLAWALSRYNRVETIGFDYGQRHTVELAQRSLLLNKLRGDFPDWAPRLGSDHRISLDLISQLVSNISPLKDVVNKRYLPGRNLIMISMSAGVAARRGINYIAIGVSEAEYSGYPDCRETAMIATEAAIIQATDTKFKILYPLMRLNKARVWELAQAIGGKKLVELIRVETHTCYQGLRDRLYTWGYGCGTCDACHLREKGWREFNCN